MKLGSFDVPTPLGPQRRVGVLSERGVVDLPGAVALLLAQEGQPPALAEAWIPTEMTALLERGPAALALARRAVEHLLAQPDPLARCSPSGGRLIFPLDEVQLRAPLPRPNSLRDFMAFEDHARAGAQRRGEALAEAWYQQPLYYKGNHRAIVGPDEDVEWPAYSERLDFELEVACVIGRPGRDIPAEQAEEYIAGYTILNDWSARDIQRVEMLGRLGPAKGKDFATSLGPWLVTPDEVGDLTTLRLVARVNGEVWFAGQFGRIYWSFPQMIAHVSRGEWLYPGDVLGSGTHYGGCGLDLDRWIQPGDVVELEVDRLGVLRNRVVKRG
ncbi:MAG: 2-hydroxyhepta-2,4-diene-1,7-dioate isomerase [Dehalococcoidia bacterium]|nr:MAG: 2-hydroxyhepta-2,4-diene-1,7-dioate isomerase [Dehalococcoidia bacterium]